MVLTVLLLYLASFLILVALIVRNVGFDFRSKRDDPTWRRRWDLGIFLGSVIPALLWGVAFANIVRGVPIDADKEFVGNFFTLLNPYALLGGLVTLTLFATHGAIYLSLKTLGDIRLRACRLAQQLGLVAAVLAVVFLAWTFQIRADALYRGWFAVLALVAAVALLAGLAAARQGREGWAFLGTAVTVLAAVASLFVVLFPEVMPSSLDPAWSLTTTNASSTEYTLRIMTWVAVFFTPVVLAYQTWTYIVFRKRIGVQHIPIQQLLEPRETADR